MFIYLHCPVDSVLDLCVGSDSGQILIIFLFLSCALCICQYTVAIKHSLLNLASPFFSPSISQEILELL